MKVKLKNKYTILLEESNHSLIYDTDHKELLIHCNRCHSGVYCFYMACKIDVYDINYNSKCHHKKGKVFDKFSTIIKLASIKV